MRTILFVDDEQSVLNAYRRILHGVHPDWAFHFFSGGGLALDFLKTHSADVVVTDVKMPDMDGLELLATVSQPGWGSLPVIIVTGLQDSDLKRRALDLGAFDLLTKPVDPEDLLARLRNVLRIRDYQEQLQRQNEALELRVRERTRELEHSQREVVLRLARAAEYRDEETGNHVLRVSHYTQPVAQSLGLGAEACDRLFVTSALHDLGKIGIPDRILLKPGRLDADEWAIVREHCVIGAGILRQAHPVVRTVTGNGTLLRGSGSANPLLQAAATIALSHHERWDGSGYPDGLKGEEIPLEARIVALVDVFDALTTHRPYRPALSEKEALTLIQNGVGTHFDPRVYAAFVASLEEMRRIQQELQDTNPPKP